MNEPIGVVEKATVTAERFDVSYRLIPGALADQLLEQAMKPSPFASIGFDPNRPRPRLTLVQRARVWRANARWWLHDRLFPDCTHDDW